MLLKKPEKNPDTFWRNYEEETGEKVLARSLGQYVSGWEEFDSQGWKGIWGLIIASSGGFRFHHFPQAAWFESFITFTGPKAPKEKKLFIPKEKIISAQLIEESKWWKKILKSSSPQLIIHYRETEENERQLLLLSDFQPRELVAELSNLIELSGQSEVSFQ